MPKGGGGGAYWQIFALFREAYWAGAVIWKFGQLRYLIKHLILLKIQSLMDIKVDVLQRFVTNKYIFDYAVTQANRD